MEAKNSVLATSMNGNPQWLYPYRGVHPKLSDDKDSLADI